MLSLHVNTGMAESGAPIVAGAKAKGGSTGEKKASAAKPKRGKKAAPVEPDQADELAAAGVAEEDPALEDSENSESVRGTESEGEDAEEGTSRKKPKKQAILKAPSAKQKPGKVCIISLQECKLWDIRIAQMPHATHVTTRYWLNL